MLVVSGSLRAEVSGVGAGTGSLTSGGGRAEALPLEVPADHFLLTFRVVAFFVPVFFVDRFFAGAFLAAAFLAGDLFADFFVVFLLDLAATFLALRFLAAAFFAGALAPFFDPFAFLLAFFAFLAGMMLPPLG